ncbi:uncharacterized protein LOC116295102 [Actinia tenebrosa]|uniref:Uncharacterized protein LOC116295102 n=1 Tax=Actinia tenebrosa TaxID=6105 RepID=A0A6P8I1C8_ACTTE|nr:uncharacterized protein LOC116295102 [Actinia tenebrosa]
MAAKLKQEDSIDELYSSLASLREELVKKYEACIRERRQVESNVHQCRKLFKPWPCLDKNKPEDNSTKELTDKTTKSLNEKGEGEGDGATDEQDKHKANPDVELLDKILAKAQRAREIQEKIDAANSKAKMSMKTHSAQDTKKKEKVTNITSNQQRNPKTVAMVTRARPTSMLSSKRAVVKQPVLERKNKPAPMRTTYGASFGKLSRSRPGTGKKSAKDYLEGVLGGSAAKSRITIDKTHSKSETQAPQLPVSRGSKKTINTQDDTDSTQHSLKEQPEPREPESHVEGQEGNIEEGDFVERAKNELSRISNELNEISLKKQERLKKVKKIDLNKEKPSTEPTNVAVAEPEIVDKKPFLLMEDGHTLSLPSKYRKMKSKNSKLVSQIHKKLHETDFSQSERFTRYLENQFDWPNKLDWSNQLSHETLSTEAQALMDTQRRLLLHANWVIDRSVEISTPNSAFSWQNVYKCYRHWQVLLGKFREVQKRTKDLMAAEGYLQRCCPCGGCLAARELSSHYSNPHNTDQQDYSTTRCCLFSTWLMKAEDESCGLHDRVTYTSDKELRKLNEAVHDLQIKELSVQIQRRIGLKALQVLEQLDPSDRLFIPIYRGLWGLVCGQGRAFPSLVLDNTGD